MVPKRSVVAPQGPAGTSHENSEITATQPPTILYSSRIVAVMGSCRSRELPIKILI